MKRIRKTDLETLITITSEIDSLKARIAELEKSSQAARERVMSALDERNEKHIDYNDHHFTYTPEHTQLRTDASLLKTEYADIYKATLKESTVKATLKIK